MSDTGSDVHGFILAGVGRTRVSGYMLSGFIPTDSTGKGLFWIVDDEPVLGPIGFAEATARAGITTLIEAPGEMVRPEGDIVRLSESGDLLITIPASQQRREARAFVRF